VGLFSFDVGQEIDLDRARGAAARSRHRSGRRARGPDLRRPHDAAAPRGARRTTVRLGDADVAVGASMIVHEVGAITIALTAPLAADVAELPALTSALTGTGPLEDVARALLESSAGGSRPRSTKPAAPEVVEDYYVLQADRLDPPMPIADLLERARAPLAAASAASPSRCRRRKRTTRSAGSSRTIPTTSPSASGTSWC
jgi:hypothetical protein